MDGGAQLENLSALKQVMQQQGMNAGVLDQKTPGAPGFNPTNVPPSIQPQGMPIPQGAQMPQQPVAPQSPQGGGLPVGSPEANTIVKALSSRLGTLSKLGVA